MAVAEICRRLDGIPLALELATARTRALTVEQIAARLDQRFQLLTGGNRAALPRQQTLAALVDWSYDLLAEAERMLFNRLAVFAGGFDLEAAEAVCGGETVGWQGKPTEPKPTSPANLVLPSLAELVDKSLVVAGRGAEDERYSLPETLRQYGWERLVAAGELDRLRERHRDWCLVLAERHSTELHGPDATTHFACLAAEHDNLRAALAWCLERDADTGLHLAMDLEFFWMSRGHEVGGRRWIEALLAPATKESQLRARALIWLAISLRDQGDFATAGAHATKGLAVAHVVGSSPDTAEALVLLGSLATAQGDCVQTRALVADGLALARQVGDVIRTCWGLAHLGEVFRYDGDYRQAQASFEEYLAIARESRDDWGIGDATSGLGGSAKSAGDVERGELLLRESVACFRRVGDKPGIGWSLG
jgi:tetratricopeptide (TPR) repeat protein